jgi:hypothetical protein
MKNNNDFNYSIQVPIKADDAFIKILNIPQWWGVKYSGNAHQLNDLFTVKMGDESFIHFKVSELTPNTKISFAVTDCFLPWFSDQQEWNNTTLIFELMEESDSTIIKFTHQGLTPALACYNDCNKGWSHWIGTSLNAVLKGGELIPHSQQVIDSFEHKNA